jgi:hypothetical protein
LVSNARFTVKRHTFLSRGAGCDTGKVTSMALVDAFIVLRRSNALSRTWIGKERSTVGFFFAISAQKVPRFCERDSGPI